MIEKKKNVKRYYSQLSNSCGLTTFLMMINPEQNHWYKSFLNFYYNKLKSYRQYDIDEFKWSLVIDYLILKAIGTNPFSQYLISKNPDIKYYIPIKKMQISKLFLNEKNFSILLFQEKNIVVSPILMGHLGLMKTDMDLKILISLFGGTFYPQQQPTYDSTGSLFFSNEELKSRASLLNKIKLFEEHFNSKDKNETPVIALNIGYHWIALTSIEDFYNRIKYKNHNNTISFNLTYLTEHHRFYFFSYNPKKAFILKRESLDFLNSEIVIDKLTNRFFL